MVTARCHAPARFLGPCVLAVCFVSTSCGPRDHAPQGPKGLPPSSAGKRSRRSAPAPGKHSEKGGEVFVVVLTEEGTPLGGATVSAAPAHRAWLTGFGRAQEGARAVLRRAASRVRDLLSSSITGKSHRDGHVRLSGLDPGRWRVLARRRGFLPGVSDVFEVRPNGTSEIELILKKAEGLGGTALTEEGRAVRGALVRVVWAWDLNSELPSELTAGDQALLSAVLGAVPPDQVTGRNGRFFFHAVTPGWYRVVAVKNGYTRSRTLPAHSGEEDLKVVLKRGYMLRGVVHTEAGDPVPGAEVIAVPQSERGVEGRLFEAFLRQERLYERWGAETDQRGAFVLRDLGPGSYAVLVRRDSYQAAVFFGVSVSSPSDRKVRFTLRSGLTLRGRVLDHQGKPVAGAHLSAVVELPHTGPIVSRFECQTDPRGRFHFRSLYQAPYRLTARKAGYLAVTQRVFPERGQVTLRLRQGVEIRGRVVGAGRPVGGARVSFAAEGARSTGTFEGSTPRTSTTTTGLFTLSGLTQGRGTLVVQATGFAEYRRTVTVPPEGLRDLEVTLTEAGTVKGRVLGPEEKPLAYAQIKLLCQQERTGRWRSLGRTTSAPDGTWSLFLPQQGTYRVVASHPRFLPAASTSFTGGGLDLEGPELVLRLRRGFVLKGSIRNPEGRPLGGVRLNARLLQSATHPNEEKVPRGGRFRSAVSDAGGHWCLEPLWEGTYLLWIDEPGYAPFRKAVAVPQPEDLPIALLHEAALRGVVVGERGEPLTGALVTARGGGIFRQAFTDQGGRFSLGGLSGAEPYNLQVRVSGYVVYRARKIKAGGPALRIRLARRSDQVPGPGRRTERGSTGR